MTCLGSYFESVRLTSFQSRDARIRSEDALFLVVCSSEFVQKQQVSQLFFLVMWFQMSAIVRLWALVLRLCLHALVMLPKRVHGFSSRGIPNLLRTGNCQSVRRSMDVLKKNNVAVPRKETRFSDNLSHCLVFASVGDQGCCDVTLPAQMLSHPSSNSAVLHLTARQRRCDQRCNSGAVLCLFLVQIEPRSA